MAVLSLAIGLAIGAVVGILGAGGGILALPVLVYFLGQGEHAATSGSLVIVLATALLALPAKLKKIHIHWSKAFLFSIFSALGAIIGRFFNPYIPGKELMQIFAIVLLVVAFLMLLEGRKTKKNKHKKNPTDIRSTTDKKHASSNSSSDRVSLWALIPSAMGAGILTGLFGVSGGFIVVPILVLIMRLPIKEAGGTSLVIMIISAVVALGTTFFTTGLHIEWDVILLFAVGSALGGFIGGPIGNKLPASWLNNLFILLLIGISLSTLIVNR